MHTVEKKIKDCGLSFGFDIVGITSPEPFYRDEKATIKRLDRGLMDGLPWYTKDRVRKANHPEVLLPEAKSIISVAVGYLSKENDDTKESTTPKGKIGGVIIQKALISALRTERDDSVLEEINLSLKDMSEC
jgi:epoxyqueuosine reductase QueG